MHGKTELEGKSARADLLKIQPSFTPPRPGAFAPSALVTFSDNSSGPSDSFERRGAALSVP